MIKLADILDEIYVEYPRGYEPPEDDFIMKGFRTGEPEIDPETGKSTSNVTYLPDLVKVYSELRDIRQNEIKPFLDYPDNKEIADLSRRLYEAMYKVMKATDKLHSIIVREKKLKK
jgi:hypothetical protein